MNRLLDPLSTVAIIFGASEWPKQQDLKPARSFRRSAALIQTYLLAKPPHGLGLYSDLVLNLFNDPTPAEEQLERIEVTVSGHVQEPLDKNHPIRDILLYYIGHGNCEHDELHFLVRNSGKQIGRTSISASHLAQTLRTAAPQHRQIIVLDCCFSETAVAAFGAMALLDDAVAATALKDLAPAGSPPERGVLLFCSCPKNRVSYEEPDADRTLFTGALLDVLQSGLRHRPEELLSFNDLREVVYDRMSEVFKSAPPRPALHQTHQEAGDILGLPAFPNARPNRRFEDESENERLASVAAERAVQGKRHREAADTAGRVAEEKKQREVIKAAKRVAEGKRRLEAVAAQNRLAEEMRQRQAAEVAKRAAEQKGPRELAERVAAESKSQEAENSTLAEAVRNVSLKLNDGYTGEFATHLYSTPEYLLSTTDRQLRAFLESQPSANAGDSQHELKVQEPTSQSETKIGRGRNDEEKKALGDAQPARPSFVDQLVTYIALAIFVVALVIGAVLLRRATGF